MLAFLSNLPNRINMLLFDKRRCSDTGFQKSIEMGRVKCIVDLLNCIFNYNQVYSRKSLNFVNKNLLKYCKKNNNPYFIVSCCWYKKIKRFRIVRTILLLLFLFVRRKTLAKQAKIRTTLLYPVSFQDNPRKDTPRF